MEVYILSKAQFSEITTRLDTLQNLLNTQPDTSKKSIMDNEEFLKFMKANIKDLETKVDNAVFQWELDRQERREFEKCHGANSMPHIKQRFFCSYLNRRDIFGLI